MSAPIGARQDGCFKAVSMAPSFNLTPVGPAMPPLPYPTVSDLAGSVGVAKSVRFNGKPVYTMASSQPDCKGDEQGSGGGVRSGTVNGEVRPTSASTSVKVEGKRVVRDGDTCTMNGGNNIGMNVTVPAPSPTPPAMAAATSNPPVKPETPQEKSSLRRWLDELRQEVQQAAAQPLEGLKGAVKGVINIPSNTVELLTKAAAEQHATELSDAAITASSLGQAGTEKSLTELAGASREQAARIDVPKLGMSNPAQQGGDVIAAAVGLFAGGAGLAKTGVKAIAKMGKLSFSVSASTELKLTDKVLNKISDHSPPTKNTYLSQNDGVRIAGSSGEDSALSRRVSANAKLRESPQFAQDMKKAKVNGEQIDSMFAKEKPLGFQSVEQFDQFRDELGAALDDAGLHDAKIGLKGTSTTFYSENPGKPLGHFWDADPSKPGDYDLNIESNSMVRRLENENIPISEKYGVFKTSDINYQFRELDEFSIKWSKELGREVNFVGLKDSPIRDSTEYILKEKND